MKAELIRITTKDNIELQGMLYEPKKRTKAIIHIHGLIGNFYENSMIDYFAKQAVKNNYAFMSFNNRGAGIVTDFLRKKKKDIRIGGSLEKFEDTVLDIKAAVDFLSKRGYKQIILQGHSSGCQKITYYKYKTHDKRVKALIELAPADDIAVAKMILKDKYEKALKIAKNMQKKGQNTKTVPEWMQFYPLFNVRMFLSVADPDSSSGRIFDYPGKLKEIKSAKCPVLAIFGSKDRYEPKPAEKLKILKNNVKDCDTVLIKNANHSFSNYESRLANLVVKWIKNRI